MSRAAVYYLATLVVTYVGGAVVGAGGGFQHATHRIFRLPVVYAGLVGVALNTAGVALPEPVMRSAHLLATAAAPVMLTLLGIELSRACVRHGEPALVAACAVKLLVAPILAFGLAWMMGLDGVTRNVAIVQSSMPTAVGAAVMAVEFNARPAFVGSAILVTTLGSVVTLAMLLMVLGPLR